MTARDPSRTRTLAPVALRRVLPALVVLVVLPAALFSQAPERTSPAAQFMAPAGVDARLFPPPVDGAPALSSPVHSVHEAPALIVTAEMDQTRRSLWTYPVIGMVAGAAAGAVLGSYMMGRTDAWIGPPAHYFTLPAGAALGAGLGLLANAIHPR